MKKFIITLIAIFYTFNIWAQKPTDVPKPSEEPIDLSNPADIIIYIVLPICAIILVLIWRKTRKKQN